MLIFITKFIGILIIPSIWFIPVIAIKLSSNQVEDGCFQIFMYLSIAIFCYFLVKITGEEKYE
jgi:TctA family transporter